MWQIKDGHLLRFRCQVGHAFSADTLGTETHYLAQANPIDNSNNPFPTIYNELIEHPGNGGPEPWSPTRGRDLLKNSALRVSLCHRKPASLA